MVIVPIMDIILTDIHCSYLEKKRRSIRDLGRDKFTREGY